MAERSKQGITVNGRNKIAGLELELELASTQADKHFGSVEADGIAPQAAEDVNNA